MKTKWSQSQNSRASVCKSISHQVMFYHHEYCLLCLLPFALKSPGTHPHSPTFSKVKRVINRFFSLVPYLIKPLESPTYTLQNIKLCTLSCLHYWHRLICCLGDGEYGWFCHKCYSVLQRKKVNA